MKSKYSGVKFTCGKYPGKVFHVSLDSNQVCDVFGNKIGFVDEYGCVRDDKLQLICKINCEIAPAFRGELSGQYLPGDRKVDLEGAASSFDPLNGIIEALLNGIEKAINNFAEHKKAALDSRASLEMMNVASTVIDYTKNNRKDR